MSQNVMERLTTCSQDIVQLKDAVLFVIDCSTPNALKPLKVGGRCLVAETWFIWNPLMCGYVDFL